MKSDDRDSFLAQVVDRGVGDTISLCVLWASVARRLGLACAICAQIPRFVILRVHDNCFVDPFSATVLDRDGVRQMCDSRGIPFQPEFVEASTPKHVMMRMLDNLLMIYNQRADEQRICGVLMQMAVLDTGNARLREVVLRKMSKNKRQRIPEMFD